MPSDKHNWTTAKAMGLIFSLIQPDMCLLTYTVHKMHASWIYLCPPLRPNYLANSSRCQFAVALHDGFPTVISLAPFYAST